jgi:hypothetical protein
MPPIVTDSDCEALFASALQRSDAVTVETVTDAISGTMSQLGPVGCASRMAEEYGDHPETACDRMRWARELLTALFAGSAAPSAGTVQGAA